MLMQHMWNDKINDNAILLEMLIVFVVLQLVGGIIQCDLVNYFRLLN